MVKIDIPTQSRTSADESVRIEVEPNRVLQTSPDKFDDAENTFIKR